MLEFEGVLDGLIRRVTEQWRDIRTDFMPKHDLLELEDRIRFSGVHYRIDGGYEDAERARLFMTMFDQEITLQDMEIKVVSYSGNTKFIDFSHRDCLGALMSLGFERKCIGDIIVNEHGFDVLTNGDISEYLLVNELKIRHVPMKSHIIEIDSWQAPERKLKYQTILVTQLRLDAIIAKAYNLSRSSVVKLISAGLVQVDHRVILNASKLIAEKQIVSVRGHGKFVVEFIEGFTKKGKVKINIGKYE